MIEKLKENKIVKRKTKDCQCKQIAHIYLLPIKLDESIIEFLKDMGDPAFDFKKTSILKIENPTYAITGIRRLKELRFTLKKKEETDKIEQFEEALINYIESKGAKK